MPISLFEFLLGLFLVGDISGGREGADRPALDIFQGFAPPAEKPFLTVAAPLPAFDINHALIALEERFDLGVSILFTLEIVGGFLADDVWPKKFQAGGISPCIDLVEVDFHNDIRNRSQDRLQTLTELAGFFLGLTSTRRR